MVTMIHELPLLLPRALGCGIVAPVFCRFVGNPGSVSNARVQKGVEHERCTVWSLQRVNYTSISVGGSAVSLGPGGAWGEKLGH